MSGIITSLLGELKSSVVIIGLGSYFIYRIIKYIVYRTKTKKDDFILKKLEGFVSFAYNTTELLSKTGKLDDIATSLGVSDKSQAKCRNAIEIFKIKYKEQTGKKPDQSLINYVIEEFGNIALQDKLLKNTIYDIVLSLVQKKKDLKQD
jgi:hypothetical protein